MRLSFSFFCKLASQVEQPIHTKCTTNLLFFGILFTHVKILMTTLPVEAAMPYPHFLFSFFGGAHLVIWGTQNCNPTLDVMYLALISGRKSGMPSCA